MNVINITKNSRVSSFVLSTENGRVLSVVLPPAQHLCFYFSVLGSARHGEKNDICLLGIQQ